MSFSISKLTENEWREFSRIRLKALRTDPSVFGSTYERESQFTEADWKSRLRSTNSAIYLIYEDQTPIGVTGVSVDRDDPSGKTAIFWGSWLAPRARGKGLSDLMYKTRIDWVRAQAKVEKIIVSHRASNLRSKFANQKHGFVFTRRIAKVWNDGKTEDEIFYELRLNR